MQIEDLSPTGNPAGDLTSSLDKLDDTLSKLEKAVEEESRLVRQGQGDPGYVATLEAFLREARATSQQARREVPPPATGLTSYLPPSMGQTGSGLSSVVQTMLANQGLRQKQEAGPAPNPPPETPRPSTPAPAAPQVAPVPQPPRQPIPQPAPQPQPAPAPVQPQPPPAPRPQPASPAPFSSPVPQPIPPQPQPRSPVPPAPAPQPQTAPAHPARQVVPGTMGAVRQEAYDRAGHAEAAARLAQLAAQFAGSQGGQATTERRVRAEMARQEAEAIRRQIEQQTRASVEQERLVAQYGRVGAALQQFGTGLGNALRDLRYVALGLSGTFLGLAGAASPSHLATFTGSLELLAAKLGRSLLPLLDRFSGWLQSLADTIESVEKKTGVGVGATALGIYGGYRLSGFMAGRAVQTAQAAGGSGLAATAGQAAGLASMTSNAGQTAGRFGRLTGFLRTAGNIAAVTTAADVVTEQQTAAGGATKGGLAGGWLGAQIGSMIAPGIGTAIGGLIGTIGGAIAGFFKGRSDEKGEKADLKRSYRGLPQGGVMTAEEYETQIQSAALNSDPLQAELLREQLKNLGEMNATLKTILGQEVNRAVRPSDWSAWGRS